MTKIVEFKDLAYMQAVRNDHLNPLIRKVENEIIPTLNQVEHDVSEAVKNVTLDVDTKTLRFDKDAGGYKDINLTPILPKFEGIGVQNIQGFGPSTGVKLIQFPDATITPSQSGESAAVGFDWKEIFDHNQKWTEASVKGTLSEMKSIIFTGDPDAVKVSGTNVTLKVPKIEPLMVSIPGGSPSIMNPVPVTEIKLTGETGGSVIDNGKLTIQLNAGGGGGITNQNFKGFYDTLGDIVSSVTDPIDGKSYAFAKDSTLGGKYYTPYFYVNGQWKELKQDPALTYNAPTASTNEGVFSIKPSDKITIDSNGQLNLDGLSTPQLPQYFSGFFETLDQLKAEVTNPVPYKTFGYVRGPSGRGWLNYRSEKQGSASLWNIVAPLGSLSYVDEAAGSFTQVFGIKKNDAWILGSDGLLEAKGGGTGPGSALSVSISGADSQSVTHDVTAISFNKGKAFAEFTGTNNDHVLIDHPQRVINYNGTWESGHNHRDYEGNIFYDETSRSWMGWGIPKVPGAVDNKWTRIAHPYMSDEVRDLSRRVPAKAPSVTPGLIGDNPMWDHIGVTFIEAGNSNLPDEIKDTCGGYITTVVQDKDTAGVTIPQYRMQTCLADREDGGTWIRRLIATGSAGSAISWSPWVKSSFGREEIRTHEKDPNAHKDIIKFASVHSIEGKMKNIFNQTLEGFPGALRAEGNYDVLMDTYGHILLQEDRGSVPYDHWFDSEGVIEFSGYEGDNFYPVGKWTVHLRLKRKGTTQFVDIQKFIYVHTNEKKRYPPMKFKSKRLELVRGDELYMHVYFDNPKGLLNKHPEIYIVPIRSYIAYQDSETAAGTLIAASYRKFFGNLDVNGDVAVKVHHRNPDDPQSGIRVYGTKVSKKATDMTEELTP